MTTRLSAPGLAKRALLIQLGYRDSQAMNAAPDQFFRSEASRQPVSKDEDTMWDRNVSSVASLLTCLLLWASPGAAQDPEAAMEAWMKAGKPGKQHEHLAQLVGTWQAETKFWMDESAPPITAPGTIEYRMVMGGRFLEEKVSSTFMGSPFTGRGLYGYDNITGKLQAVWVDDLSTAIYSYDGSMNEAGDEMVLSSRFMDPMSGTWKESRSVMKVSPDKLHYISYEKAEDGAERKVMEITATRKTSG